MAAVLLPDVDRTSSSNPIVQASRWQTSPTRPGVSDGHRVCTPKRNSLADASTGDGLRFRHDLLAAFT
jgi:hypothetical protein